MRGKGAFAAFLVAAALAAPPALVWRWLKTERRTEIPVFRSRIPSPFVGAAAPGAASELVEIPPPEAAPASPVAPPAPEAPALFARDPTISPLDQKLLNDAMAPSPRRSPSPAPPGPARRSRLPALEVQGFVGIASGGRRAIVNGRSVGPGNRIAGARVVYVSPDAVVFDYRGLRFRRRLAD